LISTIGFVVALLEDVAGHHHLRVLYDNTRAILGVKDINMLIAPAFAWDLLLTISVHLHLEIQTQRLINIRKQS
jgi:hypothetical protein